MNFAKNVFHVRLIFVIRMHTIDPGILVLSDNAKTQPNLFGWILFKYCLQNTKIAKEKGYSKEIPIFQSG